MAASRTNILLASTLSTFKSLNSKNLITHRSNQFPPSLFITFRRNLPVKSRISASIKSTSKSKSTGEQKWTHEGVITESLPNGMFWVRLENEDMVLGYISGRIRRSSIRILPGDRVKIEVSRYDSNRGRIVYRLRGKDLNETAT